MATKQVNVPDVSWSYIRRLAYTILVVWVISVRFAGIDPMGLRSLITIAWLMDVLSLAPSGWWCGISGPSVLR